MKKLAAALAVIGTATVLAAAAQAQPYPSKPVKFLVPFAAGGPADTMARLTAQTLQQGLNQTIVIDNRPGAGGIIGARAARAGRSRRLHPDVRQHRLAGGRPRGLRQSRLRPGEGVRADRAGRGQLQRARGQSEISRQYGAGADRLRQEESRQGQLRLARPRHAAAHGRRDVQAARRHRHRAHSLQGHGRRAHRHHGRPGRDDVRESVGRSFRWCRPASSRRSASPARRATRPSRTCRR